MAEDGCINNAVFQDLDILGTFSLPEINISNTATFGNSIQNDLIINSTIKMPLSNDVEHTEGFQLVRQTDRSLKFEPKANDVFKTIRIDNQELINASGLEDTLKLVAGKNMTIETDTSTNPNTISFSSSNGSNVQNIYKTIRVKNNDLIPNTSTDILEFIEGNDIILNVNENNEDTNIYESIIKYNDNLTDTSGGTLTLYNIDDNLNEVFTVLSSTVTELEYQCKIIYTDDIQNATSGTIILHTGSTQVIFTLVSSTPSNNEFIIGADADATGTNIQTSINANNNFSCTIDTSTNTLTITNNTNFVYTNINSHTFTTGISSVENFITKECFRTNNLEDTAENIRVMINNHPEFTANLNTNSREIKVSQTISQNNPTITDNAENLLGVISITNFTQVIRELSSIRISLNQNIESDLIIGNYNNNLLTVNSESFFNNSVNFNNTTFYNNDATFNNLINLNNIQINNNQIITSETDQDLIINPNGIGKLDISASLDINSNNIENVNNLACSTITFGTTDINENEISILNNHTITSAELNILDGDTTADTGLTLENNDKLIITDITDGADINIVKQIEFTKVKDYIESNATEISGLVTVGTLNNLSVTGDITVNTSSLKVDTTNNRLGIGTSTPSEKLHLYQIDSEGPNIKIDNIRNMERIAFTSFSGVSPSVDPEENSYLNFNTWPDVSYPRQFLNINRDINKQYTGTGPVLQNDLAIEFGYSNYFYRSGEINPSSAYYPAGSAIRFHTATNNSTDNNSTLTEKMCIDYQGNVGIGTTNPIEKLEVVGNMFMSANTSFLTINPTNNGSGSTVGGLKVQSYWGRESGFYLDHHGNNERWLIGRKYNGGSTDYNLNFIYSSDKIDSSTQNTIMTLKNNGNVGIGTTNPSSELHINGNGEVLRIQGIDHSYISFYPQGNTTRHAHIGIESNLNNNDFTISNEASGDIIFRVGSNSEKMRILNSGNVGIGTNTPGSYKLNVNGTANISGDVDIGGSTNITGSLTSNSTTVNDLTINGLGNDSGVLVNYNSSLISKISVDENDDRVALVYKDNAFDWVGFGTIASGGVNVNDLGILNTPLDGDFLIGLDRNNTFINNSVSKFYQEIDIIDSILRISTTQGDGDLILSSEPYNSNDNNPYLKVTDNLDFNILTDRLNLRNQLNNVVPNKVVEGFVNLLIEDHESRLQLISSDNAAAGSIIALSNAPTSGNQKNWLFHHFGPNNSNKLGIYYKTNNSDDTDTLYTNSNIGLTLDTSGNIGMGTSNPNVPLHIVNSTGGDTISIVNSDTSSTGRSSIFFGPNGNYWELGARNSNSGDLTNKFYLYDRTNAGARLVVDTLGNIGIGTPSPTQKLHVYGNIRAGSSLYVDGSTYYGASIRQMINLFNDDYGIGVQGNTTYFRSGNDFQFYRGGTHNNNEGNAGGGTKLLSISRTGQTTIHGDLEVNSEARIGGNMEVNGNMEVDGNIDLNSSSSNNRKFIGYGTIPIGGIIMWNGSTAPDGWALCDGNNGTPNLSGRFVMGKGYISQSYASGGNNTYDLEQTGGEQKHALDTSELPSHRHHVNLETTDSGSHVHQLGIQITSDQGYPKNQVHETLRTTDRSRTNWFTGQAIASAGLHSHIIDGNTYYEGGNQNHENRPPYYVLAYIMRIR